MQLHGRISSSIISAALHERRDRRAVPLPFGSRGGLLINPNAAQVSCLYGIDGRTIDYGPSWEDSSTVPPGCSRSRCKRSDGLGQEGWRYDGWHGMTGRCGFDGQPAIAWSPSEMDMLLQAHLEHGVPWTQPKFHSGYNEVILSSKVHNRLLPRSIEAFFVMASAQSVVTSLGGGVRIDIAQAHRAFLAEYGLSAEQVPLVAFDPARWEEPFAVYSEVR